VRASYRKGKPPSIATETLVFSKSAYRSLENRDLVLNPGVNRLSIRLERGTGTVVRRNRSISNGEYDSFTFAGKARELPDGYAGEIVSFEIEPSIYNGWTLGQRGAKVILKGRNLRSVEVFLFDGNWNRRDGPGVRRPDEESPDLTAGRYLGASAPRCHDYKLLGAGNRCQRQNH
jgi:hypothetical protein